MALTIDQISAASYPAVLAEMRKPANQWNQNAALDVLQSMGFIQREAFGNNIEVPLDYRVNPDTMVLASQQDAASLIKTEVLTSAVYDIAEASVQVAWTKHDEACNPEPTQKVSLVRARLENAINSHDDLLEQRIFTSSTAGGIEVNGLNDLLATAGTGTVGGIDSGTETWWRNQTDTYTDGSDLEASMVDVFNACSKGTGGAQPKVLISGAATIGLFESQLLTVQNFNNTTDADRGFKTMSFHGAKFIYSQKGGTSIYFLNPKNYQLVVSKQYFRDKGSTYDIPGQNAFYFLIYSALQFITNNRSRLGVLYAA